MNAPTADDKNGSLASILVPITLTTLLFLFLLGLQTSWRLQDERVGRVMAQAQALAQVSAEAFEGNRQNKAPQKALDALLSQDESIVSAAVIQEENAAKSGGLSGALGNLMASLKGKKILAHSNKALVGQVLKNEEGDERLSQALLFREANAIKDRLARNAEIRAKDPDLKENPFPIASIQLQDDGRVLVITPIRVKGELKGTAALLSHTDYVKAPNTQLAILVAALALILLGYFLHQRGSASHRYLALAFAIPLLILGLRHDRGTQNAIYKAQTQVAQVAVQVYEAGGGQSTPQLIQALNTNDHDGQWQRFEGVDKRVEPLDAAYATTGLARHFPSLLSIFSLFFAVGLFLLGWARRIYDGFMGSWYAYAYIGPAMAGMLLLVFAPFAYGLGLAFFSRVYNTFHFVALDNFIEILGQLTGESGFYRTFAVTILWTVVNVTLHVSIGLGLALLLKDKSLKGTAIYRALLIVPWAVPSYITALIWKGLFHKEFGAINAFLALFGVEAISWFDTFWKAFFANVVTNTWLGFPFMMVVSLGALQSIPTDLYEAADVDGANRWDKFRYITLPLLKPALFPAVILGIIWTFNMFNVIYLVSGGGPDGQTDILITEAYRWAFERGRYGYAAAYSTIIFVILLAYTVVTNKLTNATDGAFD